MPCSGIGSRMTYGGYGSESSPAACLSRLPGKRARPVICPTHDYVEDHPAESGLPLLRWGLTDRAFHIITSLRGTRGVRRVAGIYWAWLRVARSARSLAP